MFQVLDKRDSLFIVVIRKRDFRRVTELSTADAALNANAKGVFVCFSFSNLIFEKIRRRERGRENCRRGNWSIHAQGDVSFFFPFFFVDKEKGVLGAGQSGVVRIGELRLNGCAVAVKNLEKKTFSQGRYC